MIKVCLLKIIFHLVSQELILLVSLFIASITVVKNVKYLRKL